MKIQIAENIKKFRTLMGFTQNDLAVLLSVSPQAVSRWEGGLAFPDITLLPLLAKYLDVSIDELIGVKEQQNKSLEKELYARRRAIIVDESEKLQNEIRILDILEELSRTEPFYVVGYFEHLLSLKKNGNVKIPGLEDRVANARQMLRDRMRNASMNERVKLLRAVAEHEDEDQLVLWADEYALPDDMRTSFWDEMLLSRYQKEKNADAFHAQNQKILYKHIKNVVYDLTDCVSSDMRALRPDFHDPERYRMALDTLALYSRRVDDIWIFDRLIAEVRYAEALLINGHAKESLAAFAVAAEHLLVLHQLPEGSVLSGSVPVLDSVQLVVHASDKFEMCMLFLGGYDKSPLFDPIREEKWFLAFMGALEKFLPQQESRSCVIENGSEEIDASWEMLLDRASKEADTLSDGNVVVMLSERGTVDSVSFRNTEAAIDAEGAMHFLIEKKKGNDARIERLICMWHDGSVEFPSFAFREALVAIDSKNLSAQMLLNGLNGYVVKSVKATMPKGYQA